MPNGHAPAAGEWFRNPDYARTLREIAAGGTEGVLRRRARPAHRASDVQELGGFLTLDDLKANKPTWVTPISVVFKGYRIWELPPNNQGIATLEMLKILEPYDLKAMGHNSAPYLHHLIEAKKLAYADLARYVGDADHLDMPAERMLSDAFIAERRSHLDESHAQAHVDPGPAQTASETIYLTAADSAGNMVSFINSLYDEFGSGIVVPGTGFALQNRGAGFTLEPGLPNTVAPGKRPFHTLIPGFVTKPGANPQPDGSGGHAVHELRPDGRRDAGAGARAAAAQPVRLRDGHSAGDRRGAVPSLDGMKVALEAPITDSVRAALTRWGTWSSEGAGIADGRIAGDHPARHADTRRDRIRGRMGWRSGTRARRSKRCAHRAARGSARPDVFPHAPSSLPTGTAAAEDRPPGRPSRRTRASAIHASRAVRSCPRVLRDRP